MQEKVQALVCLPAKSCSKRRTYRPFLFFFFFFSCAFAPAADAPSCSCLTRRPCRGIGWAEALQNSATQENTFGRHPYTSSASSGLPAAL